MTGNPEQAASDVASILHCDLFRDAEPETLLEMAGELRLVCLARGEILMRQGEPTDCMYALISGRLHVSAYTEEKGERSLAELVSGETVGEVGMIDGQPRMGTIRATRDSTLVRVSPRAFDKLVRTSARAMNKLAGILAVRMRSMTDPRPYVPILRTIAVLGAGSVDASTEFRDRLCKELAALGPLLRLSETRLREIYGEPFESGDAVVAWLSELEKAYRFIVLEADGGSPAWLMRCMRQADRVLTIGNASSSPELSGDEQILFRESNAGWTAPVELVLLHENSGRVLSGTARWLERRTVVRHHHVRVHVEEDVGRLARILAGRSIGLALGGGGARGFAHIGVIRAIEEAGIPIDMICGVSMGAIIAGQYAMGWDWRKMLEMNRAELAEKKLTSDVTIPLLSLSSGRRFRKLLEKFFGGTHIEDLWLSYFCTSCSLSTSEVVLHDHGSLSASIRASNAVPVILPPVLLDGHVLIDGGILNNQPGDLLQQNCGGPVIVSSVSPRKELTVNELYSEMPSGWKVLRSRLNPFEKTINVPGIMATMMRTLMVASNRKSREVEIAAEFYLRPPIDHFRPDDYRKIQEIVEVGYQYTREEIRGWKAANQFPGQ